MDIFQSTRFTVHNIMYKWQIFPKLSNEFPIRSNMSSAIFVNKVQSGKRTNVCIWLKHLLIKWVSIYISTTWWVSLLVDKGVPEGTCSQVLRSTLVDFSVLRASKFAVLKLIEIVILWVYYTIPLGFSFFRHFWGIIFQPFQLLSLAKVHWRGFNTRNAHMVHIVNLIRFKMVYTS